MSIWAYLTQAEIDEAPDGDEGFGQLVRIAQERLNARLSLLDRGDTGEWERIGEAEMLFSRTVLNLGKSFGIEPFSEMVIPRGGYQSGEYTEFRARLDDEVAQLILSNARATRRTTMVLPANVKEKIRTHLHHIREHLDKANISEKKRSNLHKKLAEFEASLDKSRFNFIAAGRVAMEILSLTANGLTLADSGTLHKLLAGMMQTVAESKAKDDETRHLPPADQPLAILQPAILPKPKSTNGGNIGSDLEDDIPF